MVAEQMNGLDILKPEVFAYLLDMPDEVERIRTLKSFEARAKHLRLLKDFKDLYNAYKKDNESINKYVPQKTYDVPLEYNDKGGVKSSISNFLSILNNDKRFSGKLLMNEINNVWEYHSPQGIMEWSDASSSRVKLYIEERYGIRSKELIKDALTICFDENTYNPLKNIIESVKWDGKSRIENLLIKWLGAQNNEYNRECCRLIFAGGIHRLYDAGCKFDDMIVLVGTRQGGGKSTFVRWLAMIDEYFAELNTFDGQKALETINGAWICEVSELLALTKQKEVEAVKAFITCSTDKYRKPYAEFTKLNKRNCVFIGTSNKEQFLTDKTGNRRFYPVITDSVGYELYRHEKEIKDDILQAWAEAYHLYKNCELSSCANEKLIKVIRENQANAVEDDYREGMIQGYLEEKVSKRKGIFYDKISVIEIWEDGLNEMSRKPSRKDSCEIALIMNKMEGWEKKEKAIRFGCYGLQRYWQYDPEPL